MQDAWNVMIEFHLGKSHAMHAMKHPKALLISRIRKSILVVRALNGENAL